MVKLRTKFTLLIGLAVLLVTSAVVVRGIMIYRNSIMKRYNETAYQTAEAVSGYFSPQELQEYVQAAVAYVDGDLSEEQREEITGSARYMELTALLDNMRKSMDANDINICVFDIDVLSHYDKRAHQEKRWKPLIYVMDSYYDEALRMQLGDNGSIFPEYCGEILKSYESGVHSNDYFVADGQFGYTTTALYPVVLDGQTAAFVAVEIPMATLQADTLHFVARIALSAGVTALLLLLLILWFLIRTMISPIKLVSQEAEDFVKNNNAISTRLQEIRTHDEIQTLSESILKLENDINSYIDNLTKVTAEKERIGAELNIATQIQADMLPSIFPPFPDREEFVIYATMMPAKEVGGDFFDFFMVDDRHLAMVMADVSGKGVPAALFMVIGKTLLKDHTVPDKDLGEVFMEVNELLCESNKEGLFITAFEAVLDIATGELRFVNAGHELPFIKKKDGAYEAYKVKAGFVLAGMEGIRYKAGSMMLEPGDKLFLYTDGVPEATNGAQELYGMERLSQTLNRCGDLPPEALLPAVKEAVDTFVGDAPQFDDITMLSLEYVKKMEI